jgi:hypothetical protein
MLISAAFAGERTGHGDDAQICPDAAMAILGAYAKRRATQGAEIR